MATFLPVMGDASVLMALSALATALTMFAVGWLHKLRRMSLGLPAVAPMAPTPLPTPTPRTALMAQVRKNPTPGVKTSEIPY
jgi:hypothetical protein